MNPLTTIRALDERLFQVIRAWHTVGKSIDDAVFEDLALEICRYQLAHNEAYSRFAATLGFTPELPPLHWRAIPAVPSSAFKDATLATFDVRHAELEFHTSGTTTAHSGKHFFERAALYDASLLASFDRFMISDRPKLRFLNLVPSPRSATHSSLGYMMAYVSVLRGDGNAGWFLDGDSVDVDGFAGALDKAVAADQAVLIAGTAFAFVNVIDEFARRDRRFTLPSGSRIMETGGFKGRSRVVEREDLYASLSATFGVPLERIVAEYGMTELASQYYDAPESRARMQRVKVAPPWLRTLVIDERGDEVTAGIVGFLRHIDLANRSSVIAIQTEDRGYAVDEGIVLLGRAIDAPLRGCSLDAEELRFSLDRA